VKLSNTQQTKLDLCTIKQEISTEYQLNTNKIYQGIKKSMNGMSDSMYLYFIHSDYTHGQPYV